MEANRKKVKVHMLPTEDGIIFKNRTTDSLVLNIPNVAKKLYPAQHLYFTTDEEIKESDLCYDEGASPGWNGIKNISKCLRTDKKGYWNKRCNKIIASTDPKLLADGLPQPSQAFIEKYCKVGGIEYVNVEYIRDMDSMQLNIDSKGKIPSWKLNVDPIHNTITIHPIKDSWSREEVIAACKEAFSCGVRLWEDWEKEDYNMWDNFVKENF